MGIEERQDMSIAVGLIGTDGIVLATDSKTVEGKYAGRVRKLWKFNDYIGVMSIGFNTGYRHFLVSLFKERLANYNTAKSYDEIANQLASGIRENFGQYATEQTKKVLQLLNQSLDFILAGYDSQQIPRITAIEYRGHPMFSPHETPYPHYFGGVGEIGRYWVKKIGIEIKQLPCEFLKKLATMIILETILYSDMCGEPIQMAIIDKEGYHDRSNEIEGIKASFDSKQQWLYDYLGEVKKLDK
jgi:20S proteasome alpha/beta subunit